MKKISKKISAIFIIAFFLSTYSTSGVGASTVVSWDTQSDFLNGFAESTLDLNQSPGDIQLKYNTKIHTDNSVVDFRDNDYWSDPRNLYVSSNNGGEVSLDSSFNYNTSAYTEPITGAFPYFAHSFVDNSRDLLYVSTTLGVDVIDTQGTLDPIDDVLVAEYTDTTSPGLLDDDAVHSFLDDSRNLLYVSTSNGGLTVINTQGTVDPSDDTLVTNYTTSSSPALGHNVVTYSFLDDSRNLLYAATNGGGVTVINTQGTVDPSDDVLVVRYTTSSSPAIGDNRAWHLNLDDTNNLLYIGTNGGGVSVINTQGTVDPLDDTLVITYSTSSSPALGTGRARDIYLDESNGLLYVAGWGVGVSVINTQGTVDPLDDTLSTVYNEAGIGIGTNYVEALKVDSANNRIYVAGQGGWGGGPVGGVSVINTQGTVDPSDDILEDIYTTETTPSISDNYIWDLQINNNLLYVGSATGGLDVIKLSSDYNSEGVYKKSFFGDYSWETKSSLSVARMSATSGVIGGKIYVAGGTQDWSDQDTLVMYDPATDTWTDKAPMSTPRVTPGSGVIDGKLYVVGGRDNTWSMLDSLEVYDPLTDSWTTKTPMPTARTSPATAVIDGKLYAAGGSDGAWSNVDVLEVYDPATDTWETKAPMPEIRGGHSAESLNGKLYVAGGNNGGTDPFNDNLFVYDPLSDSWEEKNWIPKGIAGSVLRVYGDRILLIGGTDNKYNPINNTYFYNPNSDTWSVFETLPIELHRTAAQVVGDELYVIGGKYVDPDGNWTSSNNVYKLTPSGADNSSKIYTQLTWQSTTPSGTSVEMFYSLDGGSTYTSLGENEGSYKLPNIEISDFKYKAILKTSDTSITPTLDKVDIEYVQRSENLFVADSGIFTSENIELSEFNQDLLSINIDKSTPSGTAVNMKYSINGGDSWIDIGNADTYEFPKNTKTKDFMWRATLTTNDLNETPVLHGVTLVHSESPLTIDLKDIDDVTTNSLELEVKVKNYESRTLDFKVRVRNVETDTTEDVKFTEKVDKDGKIKLFIENLLPGTEYTFKVKVSEEDKGDYSNYSNTMRATTDEEGAPILASFFNNDSTVDVPADFTATPAAEEENKVPAPASPGTTSPESLIKTNPEKTPVIPQGAMKNLVEDHPVITSATVATGLVAGAAAAGAAATSSIPFFPLIPGLLRRRITEALGLAHMIASSKKRFGFPAKRKGEKHWGVVFDSYTKHPISEALVQLVDKNKRRVVDQTVSDENGRFGFLIDKESNYELQINKGSYTLDTEKAKDDLYGKLYNAPINIKEGEVLQLNIALTAKGFNWERFASKVIGQYSSLSAKLIKYTLDVVYIAGFGISIFAAVKYPSIINYIILASYAVFLVLRIIHKNKNKFGTIVSKQNKKPLPFTVIELYKENQRVNFTVSDILGRYYLLANNGNYKLKIKSMSSLDGSSFEGEDAISIKDGILRDDLMV